MGGSVAGNGSGGQEDHRRRIPVAGDRRVSGAYLPDFRRHRHLDQGREHTGFHRLFRRLGIRADVDLALPPGRKGRSHTDTLAGDLSGDGRASLVVHLPLERGRGAVQPPGRQALSAAGGPLLRLPPLPQSDLPKLARGTRRNGCLHGSIPALAWTGALQEWPLPAREGNE